MGNKNNNLISESGNFDKMNVYREDLRDLALSPIKGNLPLPALTVNENIFDDNSQVFLSLLNDYGVEIAPHATPMSPELTLKLIDQGAWGASVANIQQAAVLMQAGIKKIILANQIGGRQNGRWLRSLLNKYKNSEIICFVDSLETLKSLEEATSKESKENPVKVLLELGVNRTGLRTLQSAKLICEAVLTNKNFILSGVATYEGSVEGNSYEHIEQKMYELFDLTLNTYKFVREKLPEEELILTAGGSLNFDRVIHYFKNKVDKNCKLILRSGALFFSDHGIYKNGYELIDRRSLLSFKGKVYSASDTLKPCMRIWAEIISRNDKDVAICGMGMRDVSFDQGFPVVLNVYRYGKLHLCVNDKFEAENYYVSKLNDQHAFVNIPVHSDLQVGDIIEFGISHPCTCFDRWRSFYGVSKDNMVSNKYLTFFE